MHITGHEAAARDVIQDIFLKVWLSRHKLPEIKDLKAWLFTIAYHQSYSWLRYEAVRDKAQKIMRENSDHQQLSHPVDEYADLRETKALLQEAIQGLTGQQQKIYRMSRDQHKTIPEIAAELGLSANTVKNTLVTALKNIRQYLEQHGIILPLIILSYGLL